jgi:hypothetical protein
MIDVIDVDYDIIGVNIPGDSLRVMCGGLASAYTGNWKGIWTAAALASVGLDLAGAQANNRFSASPLFFKVNASVQRVQPIGQDFAVVARATGQMSSGTVPAAEVFAYGGRDFGRAFKVSESFGDRGTTVSAELRYAINWIDFLKDRADPQLYVFADRGWLWSDDSAQCALFLRGLVGGEVASASRVSTSTRPSSSSRKRRRAAGRRLGVALARVVSDRHAVLMSVDRSTKKGRSLGTTGLLWVPT